MGVYTRQVIIINENSTYCDALKVETRLHALLPSFQQVLDQMCFRGGHGWHGQDLLDEIVKRKVNHETHGLQVHVSREDELRCWGRVEPDRRTRGIMKEGRGG